MSGALKKFKLASSNRTLNAVHIFDEKQTEFPNAWFTASKSKPKYIAYKFKNLGEDNKLDAKDLMAARDTIIEGLLAGQVDLKTVFAYIQYIMSVEVTAKLTAKWESFSQVIGEDNTTICPLDLLSATSDEKVETTGTDNGYKGPEFDLFLIIVISALWRFAKLGKQSNNEYKTRLSETFKNLIDTKKPTLGKDELQSKIEGLTSISNLMNLGNSWILNPQMDILMSAFDMFFQKFPSHTHSLIRLGSIVSRYKDSAALLSINHINRMHGFTSIESLIPWCFSSVFTNELFQICSDNQEINLRDSYFPYHMEFKLCRKSPYSSSANPHLYAFIHIVGSLKGNQRSLNAVMPNDVAVDIVMTNALIMSYAFRHSPDLVYEHIDESDAALKLIVDDIQEKIKKKNELDNKQISCVIKPPVGTKPIQWYQYYFAHDQKIPPPIREYASKLVFPPNLRPNSVGMRTKMYFETSI